MISVWTTGLLLYPGGLADRSDKMRLFHWSPHHAMQILILLILVQFGVPFRTRCCECFLIMESPDYIGGLNSRSFSPSVQLIQSNVSRFAYKEEQVRKKPGREVVTFLLVCNLAMWAINTLETNRADSHPIQVRLLRDMP